MAIHPFSLHRNKEIALLHLTAVSDNALKLYVFVIFTACILSAAGGRHGL